MDSSRITNSPSLRLTRMNRSQQRDRGTSLDLTALRQDQLMGNHSDIYSTTETIHDQAIKQSLTQTHDSDSDEDSNRPLLAARSHSLSSGVSPLQQVRHLTHSPAVNGRALDQANQSATNTPTSIPSPSFSSPSHGHGFSRQRASSFSFVNVLSPSPSHHSATPPSLPFTGIHSFSSFLIYLKYVLLRQLQFHLIRTTVICLTLALSMFVLYIDYTSKCDMSGNLSPLLLKVSKVFDDHGITYWIDDGTLLGAARTNTIIPHEFDIDISSTLEECARIAKLTDEFNPSKGYKIYGRDDWVPEKASFIFGYTGYMHKPCARIYDIKTKYYVDIDWHIRLDASELPASTQALDDPSPANVAHDSLYGTVYLPTGYKPEDGDIWCNEEGFNGHDPGGCRRASDLFPLTTIEMYGQQIKAPNNAHRILKDLYSASWPIPRAKGYKLLICSAMPPRPWLYFLIGFGYIGVPLAVWMIGKADKRVAAMWTQSSIGGSQPPSRR